MDFRCTECDFDEDLMLIVKDGVTHRFYIKPDGSLEHYDSDGDGQENYLECQGCGQRYDLTTDEPLELREQFVLMRLMPPGYFTTKPATLDDLKFEKVTP